MFLPKRTKFLISSLFAGVGGALLFASPALAADTYEISKGDTLSEIGNEVDIPWRDIARENDLSNPDLIYPNQILKLPSKGAEVQGSEYSPKSKLKSASLDSVDISIAREKYGLSKSNAKVSRRAAALLGPMFDVDDIGGFAESGHVPNSDHYTGHALDIMISGKKQGDRISTYVLHNWEVLDVKYVIWYREIWSPERGWRDYHGDSDHTDHVHVSFEDED